MKHPEPQTASELMMQNQLKETKYKQAIVSLPSTDVQQFLLQVIDHSNFPGNIVEFVSKVKQDIMSADIVQK